LPGVKRGLLSILVLLATVAAGPFALHDHGGPNAGFYDDHCPLRVASLCGVGLLAGEVPAPSHPLPSTDQPAAPVPIGLGAALPSPLQPRAPPASPAA
jgi:hypothetical protein